MADQPESIQPIIRVLDCAKLSSGIAYFAAKIEYADEPKIYVSGGTEEEDQIQYEGQLYEHEERVRHEVDKAIVQLFEQKTWPQTKSSVRWAATRRFDWLAEHVRFWSTLPSPLVMAIDLEPDMPASNIYVPLLTSCYSQSRGFDEPSAPFYLPGMPRL